jgi:lantibiotic modifying enzyme
VITENVALTAASRIAEHLYETAFFYRERCTWCGTFPDAADDFGTLTTYHTVGSDLYDGTSGIALFLGETFVRVGDARFRRAAEGGIARALGRLDAIPRECRFGIYTGVVGIVYAAVRLGQVLDRPDLILRGREIIREIIRDLDSPFLTDIISGAAGAISMLLLLADDLEMPELQLCVRKFGEAILARASRDGEGWSWGPQATGIEAGRNLTGFAHGAAGIGWSLLELYRKTNDIQFLDGALQAFQYENAWFQSAEDNWPDFRLADGASEPASCMVAWCHGAAGIGLTRLAALRSENAAWLRRDAEAAVRASKRALASTDGPPDRDFCLCHGQCGIAAFLLRAGDVLGDLEARNLALTTAAAAAARYAGTPHAWPVGLGRGSTPSLMTGLAGIGYFYLGLADPELPSVLLFQP